jgi:hypothetical protein
VEAAVLIHPAKVVKAVLGREHPQSVREHPVLY